MKSLNFLLLLIGKLSVANSNAEDFNINEPISEENEKQCFEEKYWENEGNVKIKDDDYYYSDNGTSTPEMTVKTEIALNDAMVQIPMIAPPSHCKTCDIHFRHDKHYRNHYKEKHKDLKPYECSLCNVGFNYNYNYAEHVRNYHPGRNDLMPKMRRNLPLKCPSCGAEFRGIFKFEKHVEAEHPGENIFSCWQCVKKFPCRKDLMRHNEEEHTSVKFQCEFCHRIMATTDVAKEHFGLCLKKHKKNLRNGGRDVKRVDEPRQSFTQMHCRICDHSFSTLRHYIKHYETLHPKEYPVSCQYCGRPYKSQGSLYRHLDSFHPEMDAKRRRSVPKEKYTCEYCSKQFLGPTKFEKHGAKRHPGMKMYHCDECFVEFTSKCAMDRHSKEQHSTGNLICPYCDLRYQRLDDFRLHERTCRKGKRPSEEGLSSLEACRVKNRRMEEEECEEGEKEVEEVSPSKQFKKKIYCPNCRRTLSIRPKSFAKHLQLCNDYENCIMCERRFHKKKPDTLLKHLHKRHGIRIE